MEMILNRYLEEKKPLIVTKEKHTYLAYNGILGSNIHILKSGIVKTSLILRDGREFNMNYINMPEIVAILRDEEDQLTPAPWNIRIESETASLYQIDRKEFWADVNSNSEMLLYVKNYYRRQLNMQTQRMQMMLMNGKVGALYAFLIRLSEQFGVETDGGTLIDFTITNEEIAGFCGISTHTSVNRMMKELREKDIIEIRGRKIFIKKMDYLVDNVAV
ncbi:MAG: prfA 1 [Bacillales bacterium]|nr:prfA 1 [Bacillales bacterium]